MPSLFPPVLGAALAGLTAALAAPAPPDAALDLSGTGWSLRRATEEPEGGETISRPDFAAAGWIPAQVPGTVLGAYVAAGLFPDPWFGDQNDRIPEAFFNHRDFWYRDAFDLPASWAGRRLWLRFGGVNWKAEVFLNGARVGPIDWALGRTEFDVTALARPGQRNALAVLVHPVAHPGEAHHKFLNRTLGNGGVLGRDSPTFLSSIGWNWLPTIRGRNAGIWNHVSLAATGDLLLRDPWVETRLDLPGSPGSSAPAASLTLALELRNASDSPRRAILVGSLSPLSTPEAPLLSPLPPVSFRYSLAVPPGTTRLALDPSVLPQLRIERPRLWWPNGYGEPALYRLDLAVESGGEVSDRRSFDFGIRQVDTRVEDRALTFYVNGRRILVRGGNWGMDEGMLRCDRAGFDLRVGLHRAMHLNMIRNWVGMVNRDEFYDACDRNGILVWDDFWLANPSDGPDPDDHALFVAEARDKIRRVRRHPSLALYCGRNEGAPPPDIDAALRAAAAELDGTRTYISNSADGVLVTGHGPYDVRDPDWYFANRGTTLHSELGIVAVPNVESMRAMMPADRLWPINDLWAVHDYQTPRMPLYTRRIERRYGPPTGIEDYCRKAQMVNLESAKAMFECLRSRRGSGILIWMTQAAWPSLICQLYDYWFDPTAAFYGVKTACEPLHILWDQDRDRIEVANDTLENRGGLVAEAGVYGLDGVERWSASAQAPTPAQSVTDCFALPRPADPDEVFFVRLRLLERGVVVSENFYWSAGKGRPCLALNSLPKVDPAVRAFRRDYAGGDVILDVALRNDTAAPALMIHLKPLRSSSGQRILPVFCSDNYVSLLPGESQSVQIRFAAADLRGEQPRLAMEGWNIAPADVPLRQP